MNADEFKLKVKDLLEDLDDKWNVFVLVINPDTGEAQTFGLGCPACSMEALEVSGIKGKFKHFRYGEVH